MEPSGARQTAENSPKGERGGAHQKWCWLVTRPVTQSSVRLQRIGLGDVRVAYAPSAARSTSAMSILIIFVIASIARRARSRSGSLISSISRVGVTCQKTPQRSLSQPHAISEPPSAVSAAQSRSVSAWSAQAIRNETASVNENPGVFSAMNGVPASVNSTMRTAPAGAARRVHWRLCHPVDPRVRQ